MNGQQLAGFVGGLVGTEIELSRLLESFLKEHDFRPGQFVRWKVGLRNRDLPYGDQFGIVVDVEVEKEPTLHLMLEDIMSSSFGEPLDIRVGVINPYNGVFAVFHYDKRRLEPVPTDELPSRIRPN